MPVLEGPLDGAGLRVCIVVARWNEFVTRKLLEGAQSCLGERGVAKDNVTIAWVPGAFEIPTAASWAARSGSFDAVICIGAVIRGDTAHFEYVAGGAAEGIAATARETGVPVIFGVLMILAALYLCTLTVIEVVRAHYPEVVIRTVSIRELPSDLRPLVFVDERSAPKGLQ